MEADMQSLRDKIQAQLDGLPPERLAEVGDFVDFIANREIEKATTIEATLRRAASALSTSAFGRVWDNPEDAAYDHL